MTTQTIDKNSVRDNLRDLNAKYNPWQDESYKAAENLGQLALENANDRDRIVAALIEQSTKHESNTTRLACIESLQKIAEAVQSPEIISDIVIALQESTKDDYFLTRVDAIGALISISGLHPEYADTILPTILAGIEDQDTTAKQNNISSAGVFAINHPEHASVLAKALVTARTSINRMRNDNVYSAAEYALKTLISAAPQEAAGVVKEIETEKVRRELIIAWLQTNPATFADNEGQAQQLALMTLLQSDEAMKLNIGSKRTAAKASTFEANAVQGALKLRTIFGETVSLQVSDQGIKTFSDSPTPVVTSVKQLCLRV